MAYVTKLTLEQVKTIRELCWQGVPQTEIAKQFGVQQTTISKIKRRENWKYVA